ncbi:MAG: aminomethyl-transferring glycine dehydrogenase subunit GcvPA [Chloroflexi bacterium]|nr:aminomethyl-transferring glycine dehydrogenase subunit GcvPA [Chloroflexota bacterium]
MFTPHTEKERAEMLKTIGVDKIEDLFTDVPEKVRFPKLDLPEALSEMEALQQVRELASANESAQDLACFLGAGAYNHYTPAAVDSLLRRGEFYTAYTPYQPEVSQGTLQAIFEFQSLITGLTGMEVTNASHYDGATAVAEAGIMAFHHFRGKRTKFIASPALNPQYRDVLCTYLCGMGGAQVITPNLESPLSDPADLLPLVDDQTALVVVQYPDFFGRIFDYSAIAEKVHEAGALLAIAVNPLSLGLLKPPGEFGADIVVGEGQSLGLPLSYGGPYLGLFSTRKELVRKVAGRLVGETEDKNGNRGYVLTLTAREQHIRREKATSNICTNQGLMALAAAIYLSLLGKNGLRKVAELCYHKAHYAAKKINQIKGFKVLAESPFFNEFIVETPIPVDELNLYLLDQGILGGYDLKKAHPNMKNAMLVAVTEMNSRAEIDLLCDVLREVSHA